MKFLQRQYWKIHTSSMSKPQSRAVTPMYIMPPLTSSFMPSRHGYMGRPSVRGFEIQNRVCWQMPEHSYFCSMYTISR